MEHEGTHLLDIVNNPGLLYWLTDPRHILTLLLLREETLLRVRTYPSATTVMEFEPETSDTPQEVLSMVYNPQENTAYEAVTTYPNAKYIAGLIPEEPSPFNMQDQEKNPFNKLERTMNLVFSQSEQDRNSSCSSLLDYFTQRKSDFAAIAENLPFMHHVFEYIQAHITTFDQSNVTNDTKELPWTMFQLISSPPGTLEFYDECMMKVLVPITTAHLLTNQEEFAKTMKENAPLLSSSLFVNQTVEAIQGADSELFADLNRVYQWSKRNSWDAPERLGESWEHLGQYLSTLRGYLDEAGVVRKVQPQAYDHI